MTERTLGLIDVTADHYRADLLFDQPTLSAGIASLLCNRSPAHARAAHPRLNPDYVRAEKPHYDVGSAAHAIILEGLSIVEVIDASDWRTNAAKEARDAAREAGRVPLLAHTLAEVEAMVAAAADQLAEHRAFPPLFTEGAPERTVVWEEDGGILCRARPDWLRHDRMFVDDLKTTSRSADPAAYSRNLFTVGGDVQAAFYVRGVEKVTGVRPTWRWCVIETAPPYALSVVAPGPDVLALGESKVEKAIGLWRECLTTDRWPAYPTEVCWAEAPAWEETRWLERATREAA